MLNFINAISMQRFLLEVRGGSASNLMVTWTGSTWSQSAEASRSCKRWDCISFWLRLNARGSQLKLQARA